MIGVLKTEVAKVPDLPQIVQSSDIWKTGNSSRIQDMPQKTLAKLAGIRYPNRLETATLHTLSLQALQVMRELLTMMTAFTRNCCNRRMKCQLTHTTKK